MLAGELYFASDKELFKERQKAKELIFDFNALRPTEVKKRNLIIKNLLGKTGKSFFIEPPFRCDYGYNIEIGENFYSNYNCIILDCAKVKIGNNVLFGPNVALYTAIHPTDVETRNKGLEAAHPIDIGNNVWLGGNVVVNQGIHIGENAIIGSGSVVTKDIPDNVIAFGNPCKVVRKIEHGSKK